MHDHEAVRTRVDAALDAFVREETTRLLAIHEDLVPVADQLRSAVAGGKRIRAAFCYWGWRAAGQPDTNAMIRAAAAMELIHTAALVHDDVIDGSSIRRGRPAVHIALRDIAAARREGGSRAVPLAILVGDLLMMWAGQMFASSGLPRAYLARTFPLWATLGRELVAGECLEILRTGTRPGRDRSLEIIRFKTAKYTVERPLHIGGTLGGASRKVLSTFTAYGVPLGEAFQLRDDLLGVFGDPSWTGKSNLDDLRGHKPTTLLAATLSFAGEADRKELERLLGSHDLSTADLYRVREVMERSGAREHIESMIEERAASARSAVGESNLPADASSALACLVSAVTDVRHEVGHQGRQGESSRDERHTRELHQRDDGRPAPEGGRTCRRDGGSSLRQGRSA